MLSRRTAVVGPNTDLLKNKECTIQRNRCLKRHVEKSTETTQRYFRDGTLANRTETRCQKSGGKKNTMLFDRIAVEKHVYVATKAETSKHWILTFNAEERQQPLNQRPDSAQAKRECKRLHDKHLARTQQDYRTIPRSQQVRQ